MGRRKALRRLLRRRAWIVQIGCSVAVLVIGGVYVDSIANNERVRSLLAHGSLAEAFRNVGWLNILLVGLIAILVAQHWIGLLEVKGRRKIRKRQ